MDKNDLQAIAQNFHLEKGLIDNLLKSEGVGNIFRQVIEHSGLVKGDKKLGNMLYSIATKIPVTIEKYRNTLASHVGKGEIFNSNHLDFAIDFLKAGEAKGGIDIAQFNKKCAIGVKPTNQEVQKVIDEEIASADGTSKKISFLVKLKEKLPSVEGKSLKDMFEATWKARGLPQNVEKKKEAEGKPPKAKDAQVEEPTEPVFHIKDITELIGRQMKSAINSKQNLAWKLEKFGEGILTRFPPQPNGYLHIGHCKAMRFNFMQAKLTKGVCYLRFDDTNPLKQNQEFIENIKENISWMGYQPWKVTHASDHFERLYEFAVQLIKKGHAFVCSEIKEEMKKNRAAGLPSKDRDRSIDESMTLFKEMRMGLYAEGEYSLRAKIDYKHPNTTLRDPVIYRIRYTPHPHVGDKWCVYPLYDYTHPLCDSLEGITHSLCSLQFEVRRQLYYWVLEKLDIYKPHVWEYSRLNITYTITSKRKLIELIEKGKVKGWDDPRLPTINGMRRRGYPAEGINNFCDSIGVTRRGNQNYIGLGVLENQIRKCLDIHAPRSMAVLQPLQLTILDADQKLLEVPLFPKNQAKGTRKVRWGKKIYVERTDVKTEDQKGYYGIAPNKVVGLKYASTILITEVKTDAEGKICSVVGEIDKKKTKPNSYLNWIAAEDCIDCQVRQYSALFTIDKPNQADNYIDHINQASEVILKGAKCHVDLLDNLKVYDRFQFERKGYYCVDSDSNLAGKYIVWNQIATLVDRYKK